MEDFTRHLFTGFFLFVFGFVLGVLKAYLRGSVLSSKEELISYHQYLKKPVFWTFVAMFVLVVVFGLLGGGELIPVLQIATAGGLYSSGGIYLFMIWGANMVRK